MKNNIGYFTHEVEASEHRKFIILRTYYGEGDKGWAAEGRFWRLNSLIGKADNCRIDLNLKGEKARVAHDLGLGLKELEDFIAVLRDEADLLHEDAGVIWTEQTQEDLGRAMSARKDAQNRRLGKVVPPSNNDSQKTNNDIEKVNNKNHRAEQSRAEWSGEEQHAARETSLVENSEIDPEALLVFALAEARSRRGIRNPEGLARTLILDPKFIEKFRESLDPKPKTASGFTNFAPPPGACAKCGGEIIALSHLGKASCPKCGAWYEYDDTWGWTETKVPADTG